MTAKTTRTKVLVMVMTYPHPSATYQELVCTAGITEDGEWVRLCPIPYRYLSSEQMFRKYQWIEIDLQARGARNDPRKESCQPVVDSIQVLGSPIPTGDGWRARRKIVDALPHRTVNELKALYDKDKTSLGIVRPTRILDMEIRRSERDWKPKWQAVFSQMRLFGPPPKPLRKIPYTFHYVFECEDSERPHTAMNEDWELGVFFLREADRLGSDEAAAESAKNRFLGDLCSEDRDTRFYMGTRLPHNTWLVLGVFWPPRQTERQLELL